MQMMLKQCFLVLVFFLAMMSQGNLLAADNNCNYEKAMKDENALFYKKLFDQDIVGLDIITKLKALVNKEHEGEKNNGLSKDDYNQEAKLSVQLGSARVENILTARRIQDLDAINKFVLIAQQAYSGVAPVLNEQEIKDYTEEVKNERQLPAGFDDGKIHRLFLDWFAQENNQKKGGVIATANSEACNLDKALYLLMDEAMSQKSNSDAAEMTKKMKSLKEKYITSGKQFNEKNLSISDKNFYADYMLKMQTMERMVTFVTRLEAIRTINRISSAMYNLSNEDLLKSGGSVDYVVNHNFYRDFPKEEHKMLDLMIRLNDKIPSKYIADLNKSSN